MMSSKATRASDNFVNSTLSPKILLVFLIPTVFLGVYLLKPDFGPKSPGRKEAAKTDISVFVEGLSQLNRDCGRYPTTEEGLSSLIERPSTIQAKTWHGPYLDMSFIPPDPWGHPYKYIYPGTHNTNGYDIYTLGPEGKGGNEAIDNWTP